jgi:3-oxoacyl-[acyl-carrier-protein] synthase II
MIDPMGLGGMQRLGTLSATGVCRPFDVRRDGLVMGEGAAMFLVESERSARARGATVWANVLGGGVTQDAHRPSAPHPEGRYAEAAMRVALRNHDASSVDYVNAHGTGTPLNDVAEAHAIRRAVGEAVPVSSIKGAIGHAMAASGAIEIAACLIALREGLLPGTAGFETIDRDVGPLNLVQTPRETPLRRVLCNAFGFGGQNASVLLGRVR